jgi:large subunit ribosomal protein L21
MYAVVRSGGKQARVSPGDRLRVERIEGGVGDTVELAEVLLVGDEGGPRVGTPLVAGARVVATITAQALAPKITVYKFKRRGNYRRKRGHRQCFTELRVERIEA